MPIELKSLQEVREETPGLLQPGDWRLINVRPQMAWPTKAQSINFEDHEVWVVPVTNNAKPGLAVRNARLERDATFAMLYRLLSLISWYEEAGAIVTGHGGGSPLFPSYGEEKGSVTLLPDTIDFNRMPLVARPDAQLALALMREGRGLNHPAYSFLTFYRVLECAIPHGKRRGKWIEGHVALIEDRRASEALDQLGLKDPNEIGRHLRESGRNAVAHAKGDPIANPDDPVEYQRLQRERPIIEALASMAIEEILGVKSSHTIWSEHLYELAGWKPIFGADLIDRIARNEQPLANETIDVPDVSVRLRRSERFAPLDEMRCVGWGVDDSKAVVQFRSRDGLVTLTFLLDFQNERLEFPLHDGMQFADDGSVEAAKVGKSLAKFIQDYNANGELQIWNAENGELMSRCEAFMPVNVIFNPEGAAAELAAWDQGIVRRLTEGQ